MTGVKGKKSPTDMLKAEHELILKALELAAGEVERVRGGENPDSRLLRDFVEFSRHYADRYHHAKEENLLFKKLKERGMPVDGGPIGVMLSEHEQFRGNVSAIADAIDGASQGDGRARETLLRNLSGYIQGLREHIAKEDGVLYPMADQMLGAEEQAELYEQFEKVNGEFGPDFPGGALALAGRLSEK